MAIHSIFIGPTLDTHVLCRSKKENENCVTDTKNKISTENFYLLPQNKDYVSEFRRFHELYIHKVKVQVRIKKYMSRGRCIGKLLSFRTQLSQDVEY